MKKSLKASYTVEASMLMPLVLFFYLSGICTRDLLMSGSSKGIGLLCTITGIIGCRYF